MNFMINKSSTSEELELELDGEWTKPDQPAAPQISAARNRGMSVGATAPPPRAARTKNVIDVTKAAPNRCSKLYPSAVCFASVA